VHNAIVDQNSKRAAKGCPFMGGEDEKVYVASLLMGIGQMPFTLEKRIETFEKRHFLHNFFVMLKF
jgi:hypothetical protein